MWTKRVLLTVAMVALFPLLAHADAVLREKTLANGNKVKIQGDRMFIIEGGRQTPAKDGSYALKDGTRFQILGGKIQQQGLVRPGNIRGNCVPGDPLCPDIKPGGEVSNPAAVQKQKQQ